MSASSVVAQVCAAERLAAALVAGVAKCAMEERPLSERQQTDLLATALIAFDGYAQEVDELDAADRLISSLTPRGVG